MTDLVKCPACGIKTRGGRDVCPRCATSLAGAPVIETTTAVPAHVRHRPGPLTQPRRHTDTGQPASTRRHFGGVALLGTAALIVGLVVQSDVRAWVMGEATSPGTTSVMAGTTQTAVPSAPTIQPVRAEDDGGTPPAALPGSEPPPPAAVSVKVGNQLFESGDYQVALAVFEAAVAAEPDDAQAQNNLGQTLVRLERLNEALPHFEAATRLDPELFESGDYQVALAVFEAAVAAEPDDAQAQNNLGQTLVRLERLNEALPHFEAATRLDRWAYRFNLAHALGDPGSWHRAVEQYRRAAELFPEDYATRYNLGRALHKRADYRAAVEAYLEAIALAPGEPTFYLSLAQSYEALARPADVISAYARYLDLEPDSTRADEIRTRMDALQPPADAGLRSARNR